jgi:hypothetical protein
MMVFKERALEIEELEERKIREEAIAQMDEQDARKEADQRRHREKMLAYEKLIEAERQRQLATKTIQQDFLDKQLMEEHEKEQRRIAADAAKSEALIAERRRDFQATLALKAQREQEKKIRKEAKFPFPFNGDTTLEDAARARDMQKLQNERDLRRFQLRQLAEKKEREAAEREREKLEFKHEKEKEERELEKAQQYALDLLQKAAEADALEDERLLNDF